MLWDAQLSYTQANVMVTLEVSFPSHASVYYMIEGDTTWTNFL